MELGFERRRDRFYRRQEEKRRQKISPQVSNIPIPPPPHYIKLPSVDAELGNSFSKQKPFERCYKNSETQTDEPDYDVPINPHVNMNLYHNPLDNNNILLRNSPTSDKNSRSRLSGTSAGKRNSDAKPPRGSEHEGRPPNKPRINMSSRGDNNNQHPDKRPRISSGRDEKGAPRRSLPQEPNNKRNSIPKIRHNSDMDVNSEDENVEPLTPLYISEGDSKDDIRGRKDKKVSNNSPPLIMKDSSSSYSSDGSVTSSLENLRHLNNFPDGGMSWNERGSPEPVEFNDNHNKGFGGRYLNKDNLQYPKPLQNNDRKKRHVSDSKSIPV
ncbi:hypothetical protein KUTeg_003076 [Tegillarca granosa]|uniref:Uncharacterized protein n=1 Tax=Tegillarca granosa TaxID=220873 RepID=A0ABQ9FQI5_TEGGR|nr:hypothetical protein KUTeg_003076 [Tegillarca granosa]